ncbi:hypothetical protein WJ969_13235 [Achromobacter xylosoxidans]
MIEALIAGGVANKTIDAICAKLASYGAKKYRQYQAAKVVPDLFERIQQLDTVQTLFHDTPVSLSSFYYPSSILHSATTEVNRLRTAADVASLKNAVITGTMGQGKSMLMRWICLLEAKEGKKFLCSSNFERSMRAPPFWTYLCRRFACWASEISTSPQ